jgi:hypothetical protein
MAAFFRLAGTVLPFMASSALLGAAFTSGCAGSGASTQVFLQPRIRSNVELQPTAEFDDTFESVKKNLTVHEVSFRV